jgi:hypothetical protein
VEVIPSVVAPQELIAEFRLLAKAAVVAAVA